MNLPLSSWHLIATFLAVMRAGSLSGAARSLGLSQPTARRQIEELERLLGTALFLRTPGGMEPTAQALALRRPAETVEAAGGAFARAAFDVAGVAGIVRLTCSRVFGTEVLPPILAPLIAGAPGLTIELAATNATEDLLRHQADIAVRMTEPTQGALIARRVKAVPLGFFAHPDLVARLGPPTDFADFAARYPFVTEDRGRQVAEGLAAAGLPSPSWSALRSDDDVVQLAAVRAGVGAGIAQIALARGLTRLFPETAFGLNVWLVMHEDQRNVARIRAVFDHLVAALG